MPQKNNSSTFNAYENEIKELHHSILEISKSCFEYKKLCITTIGIFIGLVFNIIKKDEFFTLINITCITVILTFIITLMFHTADSLSYYFQRSNRRRQTTLKNLFNIKDEHCLFPTITLSYYDSFANKSMLIYAFIYFLLFCICLVGMYYSPIFMVVYFAIYLILIINIINCKRLDQKKVQDRKIFISYTSKDSNIINRVSLNNLKLKLNNHTTYIDLLDNTGINHQDFVYLQLLESDELVILQTDNTNISKWVNKEIQIANSIKIQTTIIDANKPNWINQATQTINSRYEI